MNAGIFSQNILLFFNSLSRCRLYRHAVDAAGGSVLLPYVVFCHEFSENSIAILVSAWYNLEKRFGKEAKYMDFQPLEKFLDHLLATKVPGYDCIVMENNQRVFRKTDGDLQKDSMLNLFSATKVITCTAAMQLFEQGKFLLTDPVSEYIPEFRDMRIRVKREDGKEELVPAKNPIRIKHLFSMSAGITYNLQYPSILRVREETQGRCPTVEVIRAIASEPLTFEPGTHWSYSLCHDVLGGLIEIISGQRFGEYLQEHIFEPLGMKNSGFYLTPAQEARMAAQYRFSEKLQKPEKIQPENQFRLGTEYESGGAGLYSCAEDYALFAAAMANGGRDKNGTYILGRPAIDLMRTNQLSSAALPDFNWIQMAGYGYGLGVRTMMDKAAGGSLGSVGEFGWGGAAGCYVMIDPDRNIGVFYAQHMLNNQEPYIHPRIRNLVYTCLEK